jgi:hypothetical protein
LNVDLVKAWKFSIHNSLYDFHVGNLAGLLLYATASSAMDGRSGEQPGAISKSGPPCVKLNALLVHTFRDCDFARNRGTLFCAPHSNPIAVVTHTICTQRWSRHTLFKNDATRVDDVRARRLGSDVRNLHRVATTHATAGHEEPPH